MSPFWISLELRMMEVVSGDNWCCKTCKVPVKWPPPTNQHPTFLQAESWAVLATSGSTRFRRMPTPYRYLRCRDLRSPGVTEWRNGPLGLHDDDDDGYPSSLTHGVRALKGDCIILHGLAQPVLTWRSSISLLITNRGKGSQASCQH